MQAFFFCARFSTIVFLAAIFSSLSYAASENSIAQNKLKSIYNALSKRLEGRLILTQNNVFNVYKAYTTTSNNRIQLKLDVIPIYPIDQPDEHRNASFDDLVNIKRIPQDSQCGDAEQFIFHNRNMSSPISSMMAKSGYFNEPNNKAWTITIDIDSGMLPSDANEQHIHAVQTGGHFSSLQDAFPDLEPVLSLVFQPSESKFISLIESDFKKANACAKSIMDAWKNQPFNSLRISSNLTSDLNGQESKETWEQEITPRVTPLWRTEEIAHTVTLVKLEPKSGVSLDDFTVEAQEVSMMKCNGVFLSSWKRAEAPPWRLARKGQEFVFDELSSEHIQIEHKHPIQINYTQNELRRAINQERGIPGLAQADEAKDCTPMVWGNKFSVRYQSKQIEEIDIYHPGVYEFDPKYKDNTGPAMHLANRLGLSKPPAYVDSKVWPGNPERTIVIYASLHKNADGSEDDANAEQEMYNLDVFIIKNSSGEILQRYSQENAFTSDAMHLDGISLDTANYALKPGERAFGIRASYSHMGCAGSETESLSLFEPSDQGLKPVLSDLDMEINSSMCQSCEYSNTKRTIALADTSSNGYRDLILSEKRADVAEGECNKKEVRSSRKYILHFDGAKYPLPN